MKPKFKVSDANFLQKQNTFYCVNVKPGKFILIEKMQLIIKSSFIQCLKMSLKGTV